jgi:hypothetical protein
MLLVQVGGQLRLDGEGVGVHPGGSDVPLFVLLAHLGQGEGFAGVSGRCGTLEDGGQCIAGYDCAD